MPPTSLRFLVLGCGSIGTRHIRNLRQLGVQSQDIVAFDTNPERLAAVEGQGWAKGVSKLEEAWTLNPQVVFITTPTALHLPLALEAAQRGCHLFIEKPLSDRLDGLDGLLRAVAEKKLVSLVGCNMRFHPAYVAIKKLLQENAVGRVLSGRVEFGQYLPDWRPQEDYRQSYSSRKELGGGIILDAIHEIDLIRWLMGEVDTVACLGGKISRLEIDTEDTASLLLNFQNGSVGEVHLDYLQRTYRRSCHLIGEEGTIRWEANAAEPEVSWYSPKTRQWNHIPYPKGWDVNDIYLDEMRHFLKCLSHDETSMMDVVQGKRVLEIALAAKTSSEKRRFVEVRTA